MVPPWSAGCCPQPPTLGDQQLVGLGQQRLTEAVEDRLGLDPAPAHRPDRGGRRSRNSVSAWVTSALIVCPLAVLAEWPHWRQEGAAGIARRVFYQLEHGGDQAQGLARKGKR